MKVFLYDFGQGQSEGKFIMTSELPDAPVVGDQIDMVGIGQFVVRKRVWNAMRVCPAWEPDSKTETLVSLSLYVQSIEAYRHELTQVKTEGA